MNNIYRLTIIFWLVVFNHWEMFGQRFIKTDTSDVYVLAVFYYSGDKNAFEDNYFGMVILEKTSKLDNLIPSSNGSYQYYSKKDKANKKINSIINKYYIANVPPASNEQHVVFYWSLLKDVWKDSSNSWKDTISFLSSQANMHKSDSYLLSGNVCATHLHSFEKNGISRVAAPYMYESLSSGFPPQSKSKLNIDN